MKQPRFLPLLVCLLLLSACGSNSQTPLSPEERTERYQTAIQSARDQDANDAFDIITTPDHPLAEVIFSLLDVAPEDMTAYALSVSPMNVKAYGIAVIFPAAGKEDRVLEGLNRFIDQQQQNFEQYLPDQYEIAQNARLETLSDGTLLMVMSDNQDAIFRSIQSSVESGS